MPIRHQPGEIGICWQDAPVYIFQTGFSGQGWKPALLVALGRSLLSGSAAILYEIATFDVKPRSLPLVEQRFAEAYEASGRPAELLGSFHTEFGPLNQLVQIWKFADHAGRDSLKARLEHSGSWPPVLGQYLVRSGSELLEPVGISPELCAGALGPYYEMRTYTLPLGDLDAAMQSWERAMPRRNALGCPVAVILTRQSGVRHVLVHLWPYPSLERRSEIRSKIRENGKWPPYKQDGVDSAPPYEVLEQQNKVLLPSSFSPLQ
jgi:hypothetical protein